MKRLFLIIGLTVLIGMNIVQAQSTPLEMPVAYRGQDNNIYVTDGTSTVQLTNDAVSDDTGNRVWYSNPQWSPNGTMLAFIQDGGNGAIWIAESGQAPRLLLGGEDNAYFFMETALAWSPDSRQLAFYAQERDGERGVFTVSVADGTTQFVATAYRTFIGEPNAIDPTINMLVRQRGASLFGEQLTLVWSDAGILMTALEAGFGVSLVTPTGELLWQTEPLSQITYSADGRRLFGYNDLLEQWMMVTDLTTGEIIPLTLPEGARPVGWAGDNLLYRTRTDVISVTGSEMMTYPTGFDVFDWVWGFEAESARLHLWLYTPDIEDSRLFKPYGGGPGLPPELYGYDIAIVHGTESNFIVRYVTSNVPAVLAINEGLGAEDILPIVARNRALVMRVDYENEIRAWARYQIDGSYATQNPIQFQPIGNELP